MSANRTTRIEDDEPLPHDYPLGMETRHLHHPYKLDPRYMEVCPNRIEGAVNVLAKRYEHARRS